MINVFFFAVHLSSVVEHHSKKSGRGEINIQHGGSLDEDGLILLFSWVAFFLMLIPNALILICSIGTALVLARTKSTAVLDGLATVLGFAVVIYATIAIDVLPARRGSHTGDDIKVPSRPFFFPRTDVSIQDLDQVVALCAGCVTLFFSLYEVFKASRDSVDISEHDTQHEVQQGRNRRRSI